MELKLNSVSKEYNGKKIIHNVSIDFEAGIYAFLGPNGAGKSTILRMISTVE